MDKKYYGNFSGYKGELSDLPAFTISTDPEHMIEIVGHGFKIAGAIVPNRTSNLDKIERETDTKIFAYSDFYDKFTHKKYFISMSEDSLCRKLTNIPRPENKENIYSSLYNPLNEKFSKEVLSYMQDVSEKNNGALFFPYMISAGLDNLESMAGNKLKIISPSLKTKELLANKAEMYKIMQNKGIKTVEGKVVNSPEEASEVFLQNREKWGGEAFVSAVSGAGGVGCLHAYSPFEIKEKFGYGDSGQLIITKWLRNIDSAPNIMLFIDDCAPHVLIATNQIIEQGTKYYGNSYPLKFNKQMLKKVKEEALKVGEIMRKQGYRGIGGIDGIVAEDEFYFVEINPRKNHSAVVNTSVLEKFRPKNMPPLSYLEAELQLSKEKKSYDFTEWVNNFEKQDICFDMYLLKKEGWMKFIKFPEGENVRDHDWNLKTPYFASLPNFNEEEIILPKSYASSKSDGHTRKVNAADICRIVSTNLSQRLKQIKKMSSSIKEI
ncbi:ATP-grasp domain-containing protein [Candidatus Pacearchaeota archaeon]|nr:ATP-grasp domain-containing protein [Candidatus Pacearchaeota archaeon]